MSTERRKSPRLPVALDVVLNHRAQSVICTVRDISLGGAFVDADPELLPYAGTIELCFSLPSGATRNFVRLPASIQRVTDNGAAITFGDLGGEVYFQLVDLTATAVPTVRASLFPQ
jgi:hypothetical protein